MLRRDTIEQHTLSSTHARQRSVLMSFLAGFLATMQLLSSALHFRHRRLRATAQPFWLIRWLFKWSATRLRGNTLRHL